MLKKGKKLNIAIIGATGLVGRELLKILEKDPFFSKNIFFFSLRKNL